MDTYSSKWAAQFLVAGELSRQGYKVTILLGNAPGTDLLVVSPKGKEFSVQCKGLKSPNFWPLKWRKTETEKSLYYALVLAPRDPKKKPRYFVMTSAEVEQKVNSYRTGSGMTELPEDPRAGEVPKWSTVGFNWTTAFDCEDKWEKLPR